MDITRALDLLEKLEVKIGLMYAAFEKLFASDKGAASLFHNLSIEEDSHVQNVRYQRRIVRDNRKIFGEVEMGAKGVDALIARIDNVMSAPKPPTLQEAVKLAIEVENNAAETHHRTVIVQANPEMEALIKTLGADDVKHAETVRKFAADRKFI